MKDKEFTELLNLYLDHEISPADAARLEAEVQRDPARRQVYLEYCRMAKACSLLADTVTTEAPVIAEFAPTRRTWFPALYATAGLAAAACVAFVVFLNRNPESAPASGQALTQKTVPAAATLVNSGVPAAEGRNIPRTVTVLAPQTEFQPVTLALRLNQPETSTPALQDLRLTWIDEVQISSLPKASVESLRFETAKMPLRNGPEHLGPGALEPEELSAFQFQR
jgi:hypothetical protein